MRNFCHLQRSFYDAIMCNRILKKKIPTLLLFRQHVSTEIDHTSCEPRHTHKHQHQYTAAGGVTRRLIFTDFIIGIGACSGGEPGSVASINSRRPGPGVGAASAGAGAASDTGASIGASSGGGLGNITNRSLLWNASAAGTICDLTAHRQFTVGSSVWFTNQHGVCHEGRARGLKYSGQGYPPIAGGRRGPYVSTCASVSSVV